MHRSTIERRFEAVIAVLVHRALYGHVHLLPDIPGRMARFEDAWQMYIGFAAVVANSAGCTGVVVALSNDTDRFRLLWLLATLIRLVHADDLQAEQRARAATTSLHQLMPPEQVGA